MTYPLNYILPGVTDAIVIVSGKQVAKNADGTYPAADADIEKRMLLQGGYPFYNQIPRDPTTGVVQGLYNKDGSIASLGTVSSVVSTKVRLASNNNHTLSAPGATIDSVAASVGDLILLKNQTNPQENGVYTYNGAGSPLTRASGYTTYNAVAGSLFEVAEGAVWADTLWLCTSNNGGTIDTTALSFIETDFSAPRVLNTPMTGVDTTTTGTVGTTDSLLQAIGKLQATKAVVNAPRVENVSTSIYVTAALHANRRTEYNNAAAGTFTFDIDSTSLLSSDDGGKLIQTGAGALSIAAASGVTLVQNRGVPLYTTGVNSWIEWEHTAPNTITLTGYGGGPNSLTPNRMGLVTSYMVALAYNGGVQYGNGGTHTIVGTTSNVSMDATAPHTAAKTVPKTRITSASTDGSEASYVGVNMVYNLADSSPVNGSFPMIFEGVPVSDANVGNFVCGLCATVSPTWTGIEPSTYTDRYVFIGWDSTDTNIQVMVNNGTAGGASKIDTGVAKPAQNQMMQFVIDKSSDGLSLYITIYNPDTQVATSLTVTGNARQTPNDRIYYGVAKRGNHTSTTNAVAVSFDFAGMTRGRLVGA